MPTEQEVMKGRMIHLVPIALVAVLLGVLFFGYMVGMYSISPEPPIPNERSNNTLLSYRVSGCNERVEGDYAPVRGTSGDVDVNVQRDIVILTHRLRYVCCADVKVIVSHTEVNKDRTLIVLREVNEGEMCRCLCDYMIDANLGPLEEGRYLIRLEGVGFRDVPAETIWEGGVTVAATSEIPNPASVHCVEQGGRVEIRKDEKGGEYGMCIFPDGSECEEWEFYRGGCKPVGKRGGFCGWSTFGSCVNDADCMRGGCSEQVCQSVNESPVVTTCEWRDCYSAGDYGLSCGCVGGRCQWR
ncbi:MAG: DUF333 domain-containing protein [Methanomicrobiales archaeon]|nr:DUF333 domain-containing protein [Methanomicrobiales archaeon]